MSHPPADVPVTSARIQCLPPQTVVNVLHDLSTGEFFAECQPIANKLKQIARACRYQLSTLLANTATSSSSSTTSAASAASSSDGVFTRPHSAAPINQPNLLSPPTVHREENGRGMEMMGSIISAFNLYNTEH